MSKKICLHYQRDKFTALTLRSLIRSFIVAVVFEKITILVIVPKAMLQRYKCGNQKFHYKFLVVQLNLYFSEE